MFHRRSLRCGVIIILGDLRFRLICRAIGGSASFLGYRPDPGRYYLDFGVYLDWHVRAFMCSAIPTALNFVETLVICPPFDDAHAATFAASPSHIDPKPSYRPCTMTVSESALSISA